VALKLKHNNSWRLGLAASDWAVVATILVIKMLVLAFGVLSTEISNNGSLDSFGHLISVWKRWDGPQYVLIAQHGNGFSGDERLALVFFPLYPPNSANIEPHKRRRADLNCGLVDCGCVSGAARCNRLPAGSGAQGRMVPVLKIGSCGRWFLPLRGRAGTGMGIV
jgi:hypothetical protein